MSRRRRPTWFGPLVAASLFLVAGGSRAADISATPADYASKVDMLRPGDTLKLAAGDYAVIKIMPTDLQYFDYKK